MQPKNLVLVLATPGLWCTFALAQEGLYDPAPPPNSAFVRVFDVDVPAASVSIDRTSLGKLNTLSASNYYVIPEGNRNLSHGQTSASLKFAAGKYYTVVLQGNKNTLLEDVSNTNRAKALITLYNLTDSKNITLKTADGKVTVLKDIEAGKSKSQAVNGIKVALSVLNDAQAVEAFKETQLERGAAYSVFVTGTKGNYKATWVQAATSK